MRRLSPEGIEALFVSHCEDLHELQTNPNIIGITFFDELIDKSKDRINTVLDLYIEIYPERIKKFGEIALGTEVVVIDE